jgi:trans-2,3-dihydro-3-hydroxyanthranilate isomerase
MTLISPPRNYYHVDVFTKKAFNGNSLTVFPDAIDLNAQQMLAITQEMRHFETIFLIQTEQANVYQARVFDMYEELDFAGHPLIGAGAVLHACKGGKGPHTWSFVLPKKTVTLTSTEEESSYRCVLDQGAVDFIYQLAPDETVQVLASLNLQREHLFPGLPLEVVSTGLHYLIVPVRDALADAKIVDCNFDKLLASFSAQFVYLLDVEKLEGRHWNNDGILEDVATGSAAGTVGAYLAKHQRVALNQNFTLKQGRFVGRPSEIQVCPRGENDQISSVEIGGDVAFVSSSLLLNLPERNKK